MNTQENNQPRTLRVSAWQILGIFKKSLKGTWWVVRCGTEGGREEYRMTLVWSRALLPFTKMGSTGGGAGWGRNGEMSSQVLILKCFWDG